MRLFDVFRGPHWTLLTVGTGAELPSLKDDFMRTTRIPPYEAYGTGVFLVRPDGYVAWAGETAEGLEEYTRTLVQPHRHGTPVAPGHTPRA